MGKNKEKTNVMRILDQKKIAYESYSYVDTGAVSGIEVAEVWVKILIWCLKLL